MPGLIEGASQRRRPGRRVPAPRLADARAGPRRRSRRGRSGARLPGHSRRAPGARPDTARQGHARHRQQARPAGRAAEPRRALPRHARERVCRSSPSRPSRRRGIDDADRRAAPSCCPMPRPWRSRPNRRASWSTASSSRRTSFSVEREGRGVPRDRPAHRTAGGADELRERLNRPSASSATSRDWGSSGSWFAPA